MTRCFFIGAGASSAVGDSIIDPQHKAVHIPTNRDFFKSLREIDLVTYLNIRNILVAQDFVTGPVIDDVTLEQAEDYVHRSDSHYKSQLDSQLKKTIHNLLAEIPGTAQPDIVNQIVNGSNYPNLQLYSLLIKNAVPAKDFFVVLNYDILLELSILKEGRRINYPGMKVIDFSDKQDTTYSKEAAPPIDVFKPHGSLNWGLGYQVYRDIVPPSQISIASWLTAEDSPRLLDIWEAATARILDADELVIIGSSLSKQDLRLKRFLDNWIGNPFSSKTKTKIITSGQDSKLHFDSIFERYAGNREYWYEGFSERSISFILN